MLANVEDVLDVLAARQHRDDDILEQAVSVVCREQQDVLTALSAISFGVFKTATFARPGASLTKLSRTD